MEIFSGLPASMAPQNEHSKPSGTVRPVLQTGPHPDDEAQIDPIFQQYISALPDTVNNYRRFFSALLIPTKSHEQFFQDLRQFREQPRIIQLISTGFTPDGISASYLELTQRFIESRFAHPWCRVSLEGGKGWRRASWLGGTDSQQSKDLREQIRREEHRLHKLLVPIWIAFRRRIDVSGVVVEAWWKEQERLKPLSEGRYMPSAPVAPTVKPTGEKSSENHDDDSEDDLAKPAKVEAEVAAKMFVGAALASFVMGDKRVKKYVQKKLLQKK
jgi:hypothetical protein